MITYYILIAAIVVWLLVFLTDVVADIAVGFTEEGLNAFLESHHNDYRTIIADMHKFACFRHIVYSALLAILLIILLNAEVKTNNNRTEIKYETEIRNK